MESHTVPSAPTGVAGALHLSLRGAFDPTTTTLAAIKHLRERPIALSQFESSEATEAFHTAQNAVEFLWDVDALDTHELGARLKTLADALDEYAHRSRDAPPQRVEAARRHANQIRVTAATAELEAPRLQDASTLFLGIHELLHLGESDVARARRQHQSPPSPDDIEQLTRFHFGSPWEVEMVLGVVSGASLTGLLYGLRRIWGIDLELKLRRSSLREQLLESQNRVLELEETHRALKDRADRPRYDADAATLERRATQVDIAPWTVDRAVLSDED